jgi:hypothetical protein
MSFLIYEFMAGGDMAHRIHDSATGRKTYLAMDRVRDLRDAALGYAHISLSKPRVIHRDIKVTVRNIMRKVHAFYF